MSPRHLEEFASDLASLLVEKILLARQCKWAKTLTLSLKGSQKFSGFDVDKNNGYNNCYPKVSLKARQRERFAETTLDS